MKRTKGNSDPVAIATREIFKTALQRALPAEPGIAIIHSSLHDLGPPPDFYPWGALYALDALVREGWTVALPAFTLSFCRGVPFNASSSLSETGMLADAVLRHFPQAVRTPHPIYSFAALGSRAAEIAACPNGTTFGDDSTFALFERESATVVMVGCSWEFNTQFHRYEEMAAVPYRYAKVFSGTADFGAGPRITEVSMWVRDLAADPANDFSPAVRRLRDDGLIASESLWRGKIEAAAVRDIARICRSALASNPYAYVANAARVAKVLAWQAEARTQPPLRVAVLGSFNLHLLEHAWQQQLAELLPERRLEPYSPPFGQMRQAIIDAGSQLRTASPNVRVFCDRAEDLAGGDSLETEPGAGDRLVARAREYGQLIAEFHKAVGGWSIVHRFAVTGLTSVDELQRATIVRMNAVLDETLSTLSQIAWVDVAAEAAAHDGPVLDPRLWHLGRFAYTDDFSRRLGRRWAALTLAILSKTARVVVLDLDNTMWGGVLGEDGLAGIKIGGDYPGNAFAAFQRAVSTLPPRGVALAISSKNDEDLALRAIDGLPSMVLKSADFSARRINWQPKWENIRDIVSELNLGLDSVLFVDDNPVEREAVRRNLPGVKVLDLPADPALYADTLLSSPYLATVTITAEDRNRVSNLRVQKQRVIERSNSASLEDYYASLDMVLRLSPLSVGNAQRAAQLCQKTNQFNTTTRRHDVRSLEKLAQTGADVVVIGLEDRYSPAEDIGLIILQSSDNSGGVIDLYLLSCRVLGRGIETAVPRWAIGRAAQRGWSNLRGEIIATERNTPVREVFANSGFELAGPPGVWRATTQPQPALPAWLTVIDQITQG
jgi:FkbH-like protein